ncbi:MAG: DUF1287 domain-containing protein [Fibrobacterota bacterium]
MKPEAVSDGAASLPALLRGVAVVLLLLVGSPLSADDTDSVATVLRAARRQCRLCRYYDPSYVSLDYPGGDVPAERGVCTDVVIRALRSVGMDLQKEIHEDMTAHFSAYPDRWGLSKPDRNIDHRRVPNIRCWLRRRKYDLPVSDRAADYRAGDLVTWMLPGNLPHIGIVSSSTVPGTGRPYIIHNIGAGTCMEDVLFAFPVTGRYRLFQGR